VKEIVAYARDRGIRVMPEFDTPGHTKAWGIGYPEMMTECFNPLPGSVEHGVVTGLGVINPALNQTYELISKLWAELAEVFPDKYMHLGGDEVDQECWNSNEGVRAFMAAHKLSNADALQKYHGKRMIELTKAHGRQAVVWQEMFDSNALELDSPDTVVHVWKGGWKEELQRVTAKGFRALVSTSWYLNLNEYGNKWKVCELSFGERYTASRL
jgi:hexosaminidase